jgi:hypothetical protein
MTILAVGYADNVAEVVLVALVKTLARKIGNFP